MKQENYGDGRKKSTHTRLLISRLHAFVDLEKIPVISTDRGKLCTLSEGIKQKIYSALINEENSTTTFLIVKSLSCDQKRGQKPSPTLMEVSVHV
jgi:hypothetical protein